MVQLTDEVDYLSAIEEGDYYIAQANTTVDEKGNLTGDLVSCRYKNESTLTTTRKSSIIWMFHRSKLFRLLQP